MFLKYSNIYFISNYKLKNQKCFFLLLVGNNMLIFFCVYHFALTNIYYQSYMLGCDPSRELPEQAPVYEGQEETEERGRPV